MSRDSQKTRMMRAAAAPARAPQGTPPPRRLGPDAATIIMDMETSAMGAPPPPPQPRTPGGLDDQIMRALSHARGLYWNADAELVRVHTSAGGGCVKSAQLALLRARSGLGEAIGTIYTRICQHSLSRTAGDVGELSALREALEDLDHKRQDITAKLTKLNRPRW